MPKVVDHEQRRQELAEALWRVVDRVGLRGATVRAVAEEAGWSMGALRYYFDSHDRLLHFAVDILLARIPQRLRAQLDSGARGMLLARRLIEEMLPLDLQRRVEVVVWLAALEHARTDSSFEALRVDAWAGARRICRHAIVQLHDVPPPSTFGTPLRPARLERAAALLHTYVDGLTLQATMFPERYPPRVQRSALADTLIRLAADDEAAAGEG